MLLEARGKFRYQPVRFAVAFDFERKPGAGRLALYDLEQIRYTTYRESRSADNDIAGRKPRRRCHAAFDDLEDLNAPLRLLDHDAETRPSRLHLLILAGCHDENGVGDVGLECLACATRLHRQQDCHAIFTEISKLVWNAVAMLDVPATQNPNNQGLRIRTRARTWTIPAKAHVGQGH